MAVIPRPEISNRRLEVLPHTRDYLSADYSSLAGIAPAVSRLAGAVADYDAAQLRIRVKQASDAETVWRRSTSST